MDELDELDELDVPELDDDDELLDDRELEPELVPELLLRPINIGLILIQTTHTQDRQTHGYLELLLLAFFGMPDLYGRILIDSCRSKFEKMK